MSTDQLLAIRKAAKARKPNFVRQDIHKKKSLQRKWRKPKGLHSKLRMHIRGKGRNISPGYGSPSEVKGMHPSGVWPVVVSNVDELSAIDAKAQGIVISATVGNKKRVAIIKEAQSKKIAILNIRNPQEFVLGVEARVAEKKKAAQAKKKDDKEHKKEEKKQLAEKISEEEKKEAEKQEKDKVLTKPDR